MFGFVANDIDDVVDTISKGAAGSWQMENRARTMAAGEFEFGFAVEWMRKDLGICLAEAERLRLFQAVESWLGARGAERATLLVLDDLHWADGATVGLLRAMARTALNNSLLVIGTYRDTDVDRRTGKQFPDRRRKPLRRGDRLLRPVQLVPMQMAFLPTSYTIAAS